MKKSLKIITALVVVTVISGNAMADFTMTFDGYNHGDYMDGQTVNGVATISSSGPNAGARIFDSDLNGTADPDLEVGLGNVLMLQNNNSSRVDDDPHGGTIKFDFVAPVSLTSIDLVDIDHGVTVDVILTDTALNTRLYHVPQYWTKEINTDGPNGYDTLLLTSLAPQLGEGGATVLSPTTIGSFDETAITTMTLTFTGSGAVDNIVGTSTIPAPGALFLGAIGSSVVSWIRRRRML